jgi:hypothetical protein
MKNKFISAAAVALLSLALPCSKVMAEKVSIEVTSNLLISSGYHDYLVDNFGEGNVEGGWGWYGLGVGVQLPLDKQVSIMPGADFLLNSVSTSNYNWSSDSYTNFIFLPKLVARFQFEPKSPTFFAAAELNYNFPSSDYFEWKSGGIGCGGMLGYEFKNGLSLQTGYQYIPVEEDYYYSNSDSVNMGGFVVKAGWRF